MEELFDDPDRVMTKTPSQEHGMVYIGSQFSGRRTHIAAKLAHEEDEDDWRLVADLLGGADPDEIPEDVCDAVDSVAARSGGGSWDEIAELIEDTDPNEIPEDAREAIASVATRIEMEGGAD